MQVYGPAHLHGPQAVSARIRRGLASSTSQGESPKIQDEVNISDAARLVEQVEQAPDICEDRVQSIRAEIALDMYETTGKLDVAVDRLLDEIG